jgi:hypothetical protein
MTSHDVSGAKLQNTVYIQYMSCNAQHSFSVMSALAKHIPDIGDISRLRGCWYEKILNPELLGIETPSEWPTNWKLYIVFLLNGKKLLC